MARGICGALAAMVLGLHLVVWPLTPVSAQSLSQAFTTQQPSGTLLPGGGTMTLLPPSSGVAVPPPAGPNPPVPPPQRSQQGALALSAPVPLSLSARFGRDMPLVTGGLVWRIYSARPESNGAMHLVKEDKAAGPNLVLPPGTYIVHAALGLASAVKRVTLRPGEPVRETFDIAAGGLTIKGQVGDARIPPEQISFDIYKGSQFDIGEKHPLVRGVTTGEVVVVPEGTYYIVSNYGDANSIVRSDIRVQAGRLTDVTVAHRAAVITLKLVSEHGREALASTAWSVITPGGDVIKEAIGAFPRVILAEGEYRVIARNEGKVYERDFKVINGVDGEIEVLAR